MPDIQMRFDLDMLVLSAPIDRVFAHQGLDVEQDREFLSLVEPEAIKGAFQMEQVAGAQCLVTNTAGITEARLAHHRMEDRAPELAQAALALVASLQPQHILAEIGPCGLPLDPSSAASLKQSSEQYAQAARAFGSQNIDAFFLNNMASCADLKCALTGIKRASDLPIFVSVTLDAEGRLPAQDESLEDIAGAMADFGASVAGFATPAPQEAACALARRMRAASGLPLLVQLIVGQNNPKQGIASEENPYFCSDVMIEAACKLRAAGAQFLRACGDVTPAYTGALVAATAGFDVLVS